MKTMTTADWVEQALSENDEALKLLEPLRSNYSLPYTLISYAQENMQKISKHELLFATMALTFQKEGLRLLTEPWDSNFKEVVKHLTTALGYLIFAVGKYAPERESLSAAFRLVNEEEPQLETAMNAIKIADETLNRIIHRVVKTLSKGVFEMPRRILTHYISD
ncbi:unnamed protein product [Nippostrongylus brasiliensis]|uniref:HEPN domain-containing protein n=1 Tax=Nippostrongylus brasiliensis TaxID=27835 RepID=A0A0N4YA16_NIPBR|nr:unnamed protein product [Nippostrongylus brasiliensis]